MDYQKRKYINEITSNIIKIFGSISVFPVEVEKIVKELNGKIKYDSDQTGLDAKIERTNKDYSFIITLYKTEPNNRKRFSIAHELGHLFLHMGYLINEKKWEQTKDYSDLVFYRKGNQKQFEEYEANEFAASLLMPENDFLKKIQELKDSDGYCNLNDLAEYFGVSSEAAKIRGKVLKVFPSYW